MARKKKPSGAMRRGPFAFQDLERAIKLGGWKLEGHGDHPNYNHPRKSGKVQLDKKWTGIRANDTIFSSVARQASLSNRQLLQLLNE